MFFAGAVKSAPQGLFNCYRILKEYNMYRKETEDQQRKVDKYIADAADEWDIKTQVCDLQSRPASISLKRTIGSKSCLWNPKR